MSLCRKGTSEENFCTDQKSDYFCGYRVYNVRWQLCVRPTEQEWMRDRIDETDTPSKIKNYSNIWSMRLYERVHVWYIITILYIIYVHVYIDTQHTSEVKWSGCKVKRESERTKITGYRLVDEIVRRFDDDQRHWARKKIHKYTTSQKKCPNTVLGDIRSFCKSGHMSILPQSVFDTRFL